jgi:dual-specificity kinase
MSTTSSQAQPVAEPQPPRKKRRSREPDWKTFYKNGLPKEIIVIDDTPEPERPNAASAAAQALANGRQPVPVNGANSSSAKKRKRDDEPARYDPVHHSAVVGSHTPSKSTAASDRTNSAIHTTAATSLGSLSSNGQYDYETQPGQKRKRTTRQQIANEARRREAAIFTDALAHYRPPPYPPKKARDVHIKVVPDVSGRDPPLYLISAFAQVANQRRSRRTARASVSTTTTAITLWFPIMT